VTLPALAAGDTRLRLDKIDPRVARKSLVLMIAAKGRPYGRQR